MWAKKRKVDGNRRGSKLGEGSFTVLLASSLRVRRQKPGEIISPGNFQFPLSLSRRILYLYYIVTKSQIHRIKSSPVYMDGLK